MNPDRLLNLLVERVLLPAVNAIPVRYKTLIGFALAVTTFGIHELSDVLDGPIAVLGGATQYGILMPIFETLFGVGLLHKAHKAEPPKVDTPPAGG